MSTADSGPGAPPVSKECPDGKIWDEASGACITPPEAESVITVKQEGLVGVITRAVDEYMKQYIVKLDKMFSEKIDAIVKAKEAEVDTALRKSFGLEKDPVLHLSDFQRLSRKLQLEVAEPAKKSPASPEAGTGPEGTLKPTSKIEAIFKEFGV